MQRLKKGDVAKLPPANVRNDNFLQRLFVTWVYGIVRSGRKGQLQQAQLAMPQEQAAEVASERFQQAWATQTARMDGSPSLLRALMATFGLQFAIAGVFKLMWSTFVLLGASYFVNALIEFVQKKHGWDAIPNKGVGWVLACSFFLDSIFAGLALQRMGDVSMRVGIKVRAALITAIYRKSFRLPSAHNADAGNVVSLVSTDCIKMYEGVQHFHNVWTAPLEAAAIIGLLLWRTGGKLLAPIYGHFPGQAILLTVWAASIRGCCLPRHSKRLSWLPVDSLSAGSWRARASDFAKCRQNNAGRQPISPAEATLSGQASRV